MGKPPPDLIKSRLSIVLVLVICSLPFVAATVAYKLGWRPQGSVNYGTLLGKARPLTNLDFRGNHGRPVSLKDLRGKWSMVYVATGKCGKSCQDSLYKMRQVRQTQGKHMGRVQNVYIYTMQGLPDPKMTKEYPFRYWRANGAAIKSLAHQLRLPKDHGSPLDGKARIYLIDPIGNFFMFYKQDANPTGMRKDLRRVLRISSIG